MSLFAFVYYPISLNCISFCDLHLGFIIKRSNLFLSKECGLETTEKTKPTKKQRDKQTKLNSPKSELMYLICLKFKLSSSIAGLAFPHVNIGVCVISLEYGTK